MSSGMVRCSERGGSMVFVGNTGGPVREQLPVPLGSFHPVDVRGQKCGCLAYKQWLQDPCAPFAQACCRVYVVNTRIGFGSNAPGPLPCLRSNDLE